MVAERWLITLLGHVRTVRISRQVLIKTGIAFVLVCALAALFPRGEAIELDYKVGSIWSQPDLIAPFSFPIFRDEREYSRDVETARNKVFKVFERDSATTERELTQLHSFFGLLREALAARRSNAASGRRPETAVIPDSLHFAQLSSALDVPFTPQEWDQLDDLSAGGRLQEVEEFLTGAFRTYLCTGILEQSKALITRSDVALRQGTIEDIVPVDRFYDESDIVSLLEKDLRRHYGSDEEKVGIAYKIGITHLSPNVKFDSTGTQQAIAASVDAVPRTLGYVQENERIVSKHERITSETKLKLESMRRVRGERGGESGRISQYLGTVLHVTVVVMLFGIYLFLFRKRIVGNNRRLALIASLILFEGLLAFVSREADVRAPVEYLILVPVASMALTIVFDSRVGFYGTVIIAYLIAGIRGNDYTIALASLVAGALSVYTVRDMKNRNQIFRSLGFIFLGYALSIAALGLERYESLPLALEQLAYGGINAVLSPVLTYGVLIFLERVFRVTTDLALVELGHFEHPLLRLLASRAPGTYHHSLVMASLAEAGAAAVGANVVLARVGAYFHDVGKIVKPTYFVENQKGSRNRHDRLSPRMSSLIIAAHVKDGMGLAREHHIPQEVIDFIPMHHGTTLIDYFYTKALQMAHDSPDETKIDEINEQDYRYPGPKPQTKETGIMMLADAIEAAVRSIDDPTPQKLEATINELIKKRFEEGELDECPLTLKDLTNIKAAFVNVLVGIYHQRVKYPENGKKRPRRERQSETGGGPEDRTPHTVSESGEQ